MQKLFLMIGISFFLVTISYGADSGEAVFQSNHCGTCHKPDISKSNPSLPSSTCFVCINLYSPWLSFTHIHNRKI